MAELAHLGDLARELGGLARGGGVGGGQLLALLHVAVAFEEALDGVVQLARGGVAILGVERRGLDADGHDLGGNSAGEGALGDLRIALAEGGVVDGVEALALVERLEREHLEEDDAERVDVGARVELIDLAAELLGRHVAGRAHDLADLRLRLRAGGDDALVGILAGGDLGEAPVEQVHLAEITEHDVAGLEIAVQHAARVGEGDREADAAEGGEELAARVDGGGGLVALLERVHDGGERLAVEALHGEEGRAVGPHAEVVDGHDRGVLELALHAGLALEAHARVGLRRGLLAEELHRDLAADAAVLALRDEAHATLAEDAERDVAGAEALIFERREDDADGHAQRGARRGDARGLRCGGRLAHGGVAHGAGPHGRRRAGRAVGRERGGRSLAGGRAAIVAGARFLAGGAHLVDDVAGEDLRLGGGGVLVVDDRRDGAIDAGRFVGRVAVVLAARHGPASVPCGRAG
ncbi:MAG: hypothetical protein QM820_56325 [Minicystis sp.]